MASVAVFAHSVLKVNEIILHDIFHETFHEIVKIDFFKILYVFKQVR